MITAQKMVQLAKHVEQARWTRYYNHYMYGSHPGGNCGLVRDDGSQSYDCNNFVKSLINDPNIAYSTQVWDYAVPGQVIPDVTEYGLLQLCTGIQWGNFGACVPAEVLYMTGHIGLFVGEYRDPSGTVNCIEATAAMGGGVLSSYCAPDGGRYDHKGGNYLGRWLAHGKLTKYIDYSNVGPTPPTPPTPTPTGDTKFTYQVWDDVNNQWLPNVVNTADYAGIYGSDVCCVLVSASAGNVRYAAHTWKGDASEHYPDSVWLPEVVNRTDYAGLQNRPIDGFILFSDKPAQYRVHRRKEGDWLPWVYTKDASYKNAETGFAGVIGCPIDALQIAPV